MSLHLKNVFKLENGSTQPLLSLSVTWYRTRLRQVWLKLFSLAYVFAQVLWSCSICQRLKQIRKQRSVRAAPAAIQFSPSLNMQGQIAGAAPLSHLFIHINHCLPFRVNLKMNQVIMAFVTSSQALPIAENNMWVIKERLMDGVSIPKSLPSRTSTVFSVSSTNDILELLCWTGWKYRSERCFISEELCNVNLYPG